MTCIFCNRERHEQELTCAAPVCRARVRAMPWEKVNAIREAEALEHWRANPGGNWYIHMTPRDDADG